MVTFDDECGVFPAGRLLKGGENAAEFEVGQGKVIDVGAATVLGVCVGLAVPDVGAVRDGEMEEDEVCQIVAEQLSGVLFEIDIGFIALPDIEGAEKICCVRGLENGFAGDFEGKPDVTPKAGILGHGSIEFVQVHPVAVIDCCGVDGAVWVVPADGGGAPALLPGVREYGLGTCEWMKTGLTDIANAEVIVEGELIVADDATAEQRGDYVDGPVADGLGIGEDGTLAAQSVEVRKSEIASAVLVDLIV